LHLASELVIDAIVQPHELRDDLIRRIGLARNKERRFADRRHGVPPV
jgi:methylmalonyl-CoA decarboxylase subunit alpha